MDRLGKTARLKRLFYSVGIILLGMMSVSVNTVYSTSMQVMQPAVPVCNVSTPPSGTYTVTLCFTAPGDGSILSGAVTVTASASVTGTNPGVQRMVFYLNGAYLLTDYQSPYTFLLPTTRWQDGVYTLEVEALMRDGYTTTNRANLLLTFNNGITSPPVNHLIFTPATGTTPPTGAPFIVAATGDGASGEINSGNVVNLIASMNPNLFLYLGDVYENGSVAEFYNWYGTGGANFSRFLSITDPTIGNHEYTGGSAPGYFDYWNNIPDYYSFNAGGWHFVSLNANATRIGVSKTSAQYAWLAADLAANATACTIVFYHQPLFNIGPEGETTAMSDIWALIAQDGVSIVLNGHDHDYQRWVPLDGNGNPSTTGVTEFVAGVGGHGLQTITGSDSRVAFFDDNNPEAFGALRLALTPTEADFSYINTSDVTLDSGTIPCGKANLANGPSAPGDLTATAIHARQVDLGWLPSSGTGVSGYTIYRDGGALATVPSTSLSYMDTSVEPDRTYTYSVDAFDQEGKHSNPSADVKVTTPFLFFFLPSIQNAGP